MPRGVTDTKHRMAPSCLFRRLIIVAKRLHFNFRLSLYRRDCYVDCWARLGGCCARLLRQTTGEGRVPGVIPPWQRRDLFPPVQRNEVSLHRLALSVLLLKNAHKCQRIAV